jgi:AraC family transcriptional regulator, exoenzyme S synthesis regulatory protein ExsA
MSYQLSFDSILYSCLDARERGREQYVPTHLLTFVVAGEVRLQTAQGALTLRPGSIWLIRGNQLARTVKIPPLSGEPFQAISIALAPATLRRYFARYAGADDDAPTPFPPEAARDLSADPFLQGYRTSLLAYLAQPAQFSTALSALKLDEAIGLLLRHDPQLADWLFDFAAPTQVDLAAFMRQHYAYNVPLAQFAKLTGRSLATFRRDFRQVFGRPPQQWLRQQRLEQAHRLLLQQQAPAKVYLEVGFENLAHFATAFRQQFGYPASCLLGGRGYA